MYTYGVGDLAQAPSTAVGDSIERIVRRGFELIKQPEQFGIRLSAWQRERIGCWLLRLLWLNGDDRFISAQAVLDFRNLTYKQQPDFSSARQWLLPAHTQRTGRILSDPEILRSLVLIDQMIIDGRHKI